MKKVFTFGILMLFVVLVNNVHAAQPILQGIGNKEAFQDTKFELIVTATDASIGNVSYPGHALSLSVTGGDLSNPITVSTPSVSGQTVSWTISFTPKKADLGDHDVVFKVSDNSNPALTASENVTLSVFPQQCEKGNIGKLDISDIDLDEDTVKVGDTVKADVDVDNNGNKNLNVVVEAFLYDVANEDKIDTFKSDSKKINDGDTEKFDVELKFPFDNDLDEGTFKVFVKAFEKGSEEDNCNGASEDVELERDDADVVVKEVRVNPSSVQPGETVEFAVDLLNAGNDDQDDVTLEVINSQLGVNMRSDKFTIERAGDDDERTERFTIKIPESAQPRDYTFNIRVLDDSGDTFERGDDFATVTVEGQPKPVAELDLSQQSFDVNSGETVTLPVTVKNTGGGTGSFVLTVTPAGSWASQVTQVVSILANSDQTVNVPLNVKSDTSTGSYTALVELKSGAETLQSGSVTINVKNPGLGGVTGGTVYTPRASSAGISTVFWIIADIALVVVIIYFITLLFRRKK